MKVLFICGRAQWRSPTAVELYRRDPRAECRARAMARNSPKRVKRTDIDWAELIVVMEQAHKKRLLDDFREAASTKTIHVLEIPDEYRFMDPELIELLQTAVEPLLPSAHDDL